MHNSAGFIREAIDSVLAQSGFRLQIIAVDNRSSDDTVSVVRGHYGSGVTLAEEPLPGAGHARNAGVRLAVGTYLAFLDADDVWLPGKLERQLDALASSSGAELSFTHAREFHSESLPDEQRRRFPCRPDPYPCLSPSSFACRLDSFWKTGEFPPVLAGEFISWYGLAQHRGLRTAVLPDVLVKRRVHATNTTRSPESRLAYALAAKWLLDQKRGSNPVPDRS